jgi:hypothetical protein
LFCDLLRALKNYDPAKGSIERFCEIVLSLRSKNYLRDRLAQKKGRHAISVDSNGDISSKYDCADRSLRRANMDKATKFLNLRDRTILLLLQNHPLTEISALFSIPYGHLYTTVRKIRESLVNRLYFKEKIMTLQPENLTAQQISKLPINDLTALNNLIRERLAEAKTMKERLDDGLNLRFSLSLQKELQNQSKDTGTVHFREENFKITAEVPKKVAWDAQEIERIANLFSESTRKEIFKVSYSVDENLYLSLPPQYKEALAPARTVIPGKIRYKIAFDGDGQ